VLTLQKAIEINLQGSAKCAQKNIEQRNKDEGRRMTLQTNRVERKEKKKIKVRDKIQHRFIENSELESSVVEILKQNQL